MTLLLLSKWWHSRLPLARELLRLSDLRGGHPGRECISIVRRISIMRPRQVEPHVCLRKVLWNAEALSVHQAEIELSSCVALVGSFA
jgi:hypothetical protein